jgi:hypothetical protein
VIPDQQEAVVDVTVTPDADRAMWNLTDLLGRSLGHIVEEKSEWFSINPDGRAVQTIVGIKQGPYVSLDSALAAIEKHTKGVCRRSDA